MSSTVLLLLPGLLLSQPDAARECNPVQKRIVRMLVLLDLSGSVDHGQLKKAIFELVRENGFMEASQGCHVEYAVRGFFSKKLPQAMRWSTEACEQVGIIKWMPQQPQGVLQWKDLYGINDDVNITLSGERGDSQSDTPLLAVASWLKQLQRTESPPGPEESRTNLLILASDTIPECHVNKVSCDAKNRQRLEGEMTKLGRDFVERWRQVVSGYERIYVVKVKIKSDNRSCSFQPVYADMVGWESNIKANIRGFDLADGQQKQRQQQQQQVEQLKSDIKDLLRETCKAALRECCHNGLDDDEDGQVDEGCCGTAREQGFPEVVAVGRGERFSCSGVVVAERAVLTARHCLPADTVALGESLRGKVKRLRVLRALVPSEARRDVALLELEAPAQVEPRQRRGVREDTPLASMLTHVGFGARDSAGVYGFGDKHAMLLDAQGWGCTRERALRLGCDPDHELFVPGSPGRDTCRGDSGGPLYEEVLHQPACLDGSLPTQFRTDWRLVGITSRSAEGSRVACGEGGIYTRVDKLAPWLDAALEEIRRRPAAERTGVP